MLEEVLLTNEAQAGSVVAPPWSADGWIEISTLRVARGPREYDHLIADRLVEMAEPGPVTGWHVRLTDAGRAAIVALKQRIEEKGRERRGKTLDRQQMSMVPI